MHDEISVYEAAIKLNVTPHGVRYMIRSGRLLARRIGPPGRRCIYLININDLKKLMESRKRSNHKNQHQQHCEK